jgi:hypothetical protein
MNTPLLTKLAAFTIAFGMNLTLLAGIAYLAPQWSARAFC